MIKLKHGVDLLYFMVIKEIKTRYKKALFGVFWMILNPLLQMLIIGIVFGYITKSPIENYYVYLFSGLLPWNFFSYTLSKTTPSIVFERTLIEKAKFPNEVIIYSIILSNGFHTLVSILLFLPIVYFHGLLSIRILWLFPALFWLLLVTTGFSLFFSALNVRYRDVNFFVQATLPLFFYATPILYPLNFLPENISKLIYANPMTGVVSLFQAALNPHISVRTDLIPIALISTVFVTILGITTYKKRCKFFVDWL